MASYNKKDSGENKEQEFADIQELMRSCADGDSHNRNEMIEDIEFRHGNQWEEQTKREREIAKRPMLTFNRMETFIDQVVGEFRQQTPSIKVLPLDENPDAKVLEGYESEINEEMKLSDVYEGMIKSIEASSNARVAYNTALDHAAGHGMGWLYVKTVKRADNAFKQELRIQRVADSMSCYIDSNCLHQDGRDANIGFVVKKITIKRFKEMFPNKDTSSSVDVPNLNVQDDYIAIAEVYCRKLVKTTVYLMSDGSILDKKKAEPILDELAAKGVTVVDERTDKDYAVKWYIVSGSEILDEGDWDGKHIPLVPVYGKELQRMGKTYRRGVIRHAKDAQRLYNLFRSTSAERADTAPKAPYLVALQQIKDKAVKKIWDSMSTRNLEYLPYVYDDKAPIPQRQQTSMTSPADVQEIQMASDDMKSTTGIYDASLGAKSNETSGRAILARQREGDTATFAYSDNLSIALEQVGRILVDMIPKIYDTEQVVRILNIDDTDALVKINSEVEDEETGNMVIVNDLSAGRFEVRVSTGASYATQKLESADSMMQFVDAIPAAGQAAMDIIADNMDWTGSDQLAKRLRKILPPEVTEDDDEPKAPVPPTPEQQLQKQEFDLKSQELEVKQAEIELKRKEIEAEQTDAAIQRAIQEGIREALSNDGRTASS